MEVKIDRDQTEREQIAAYLAKLVMRARTHEVKVALSYACAAVLGGYDKPGQCIQPPEDLFRRVDESPTG